jgi:hypothetical protein
MWIFKGIVLVPNTELSKQFVSDLIGQFFGLGWRAHTDNRYFWSD